MGLISSAYEYPIFPVLLVKDAAFSPVYLSSVNDQMALVMSTLVYSSILFHYDCFCAGAIVLLLLQLHSIP